MTKRSIKHRRRQLQRKRQLQRRLAIAALSAFIVFLIAGIEIRHYRTVKKQVTATSDMKRASAQKTGNSSNKSDTASDETTKEETEEEHLARVKKKAETKKYPKDVIELLSKNPETVDFVEDYETKKDEPVAKNIGSDYVEGQIPKLIQWDERWGYKKYGTSIVAASGCGPTCLSMVFIKLTGNSAITPATVADYGNQLGALDDENNTLWSFMSEAATNWGIQCTEGMLTEEQVQAELAAGHPVICSVGPGDFTQVGHFIVLASYNNGQVEVRDPFNKERTEKTWNYKDIEGQFVEMWTYSK